MLEDGRQSERALVIRKGTLRHLASHGVMCLCEVPLPSGRRADLMGIAGNGEIWIIEIKSSREDWLADRKWPEYRLACDRLFFATSPDVDATLFPTDAGLIIADGFGGACLREAPAHPLAAATRKALLIRLARLGGQRFMVLQDPSILQDPFLL